MKTISNSQSSQTESRLVKYPNPDINIESIKINS